MYHKVHDVSKCVSSLTETCPYCRALNATTGEVDCTCDGFIPCHNIVVKK